MTAQTRPDELIRILRAEFVTKAGGVPGAACVTFICGATGWRATGGTIARTLVHEVAFQLDTGGNARGAYAIDLQHDRANANEVAGGAYSIILGGDGNRITDTGGASEYSSISGGNFNYLDDAYDCHVHGSYHDLTVENYAVHISGENMDIEQCDYGFFAGSGHDVSGVHAVRNASGIFSFIEQNDFISNTNDYPTYCGSFGILNILEGDVFLVFQTGEENKALGVGTPGEHVLWSEQHGYDHYLEHVECNYQFGQSTKSHRPTYDAFYDGRNLLSGDYSADSPSDGTGRVGGYFQTSRFAQSDVITTWPVAWTTSRFEFPIINDSVWGFSIRIMATEVGCANSYDWLIEGAVENDGGVTTILWSTVTNNYRDVATKEWQAAADNPNNRLIFQFRDTGGPDVTTTHVQMHMFTTEVGYEA